jgi:regulation of enolase protein 1 (concanavalin A-like superfamily)
MRKSALLFLLIVCFVSSFSQTKNEITIEGIPAPLSWDNAPLSYNVSGNSITIKAGKETDFYCFADGRYFVHNAPTLLFTPDNNFIFSARIKTDFNTTYDGGAILVYSDSLNWAKVLFERNEDGSLGLGVSFVNNKKGDDSYHTNIPGKQVYTKVVRSGNIFCFYYAVDGKSWKLLRTFPYHVFKNLRIGFYAQSPKGESCTVEFSDIRYRPEAFKTFSTGE